MIKLCVRIACLLVLVTLTGCASHTRSMAQSIKPSSEKFKETVCQRSFELAPLHDEIRLTRTIATPTENILEKVVLGAGFSLFTGNVKLGIN